MKTIMAKSVKPGMRILSDWNHATYIADVTEVGPGTLEGDVKISGNIRFLPKENGYNYDEGDDFLNAFYLNKDTKVRVLDACQTT